MQIPTRLKIVLLRRRLRRQYLAYQNLRSGDGGRHITNIITGGRVDRCARRVNETLDRLSQLDPAAPAERLEVEGD